MTVIAGLVSNGKVYMGSDNEVTAGWEKGDLGEGGDKVFHLDRFLIGVAGTVRSAQVIRFHFDPPFQRPSLDKMDYMVSEFIPTLQTAMNGCGYQSLDNGVKSIGPDNCSTAILVGFSGSIFRVSSDYSVLSLSSGYDAIGSGAEIARGILYASRLPFFHASNPQQVLEAAILGATKHSIGVGGPHTFIEEKTDAPNEKTS